MAVSLKHTFQSAKTDSGDATVIQPSNWNQEHVLTAGAGKVLGRDTSGAGAVQELPIAVTAGGNVGIGTTTPANPLSVAGLIESTTGGFRFPDGTTQTTASVTSVVQYPQNIKSANYTLVLSDAGKQIFHPASDAVTRTFTIPSNATVPYVIGTVVLITVENGAGLVNVAIDTDTLVFGNGTTGTIPVPTNNTLMCIKVTATKWMANYLYQTGAPAPQSIAVGGDVFPEVSVYPWSETGFGLKFANPATNFNSSIYGLDFSPSGDALVMAMINSPYIGAYSWSPRGFGVKFSNPATVVTNGGGASVAFNPAGNAVALAFVYGVPYVAAYSWSAAGFGTKFSDPATLPTGAGRSVAFNPAGTAIAVAHDNSPYISVYPWSGSGFGTKFANPATLPGGGAGRSVAFNPAGDTIAVASNGTPFVTAYPWSGAGFGTKFANPATLPTGTGNGVAFSPAGDAIAVSHTTSPYVTAYPWSGSGFGTKFSDPATLPTGNGYSVAFNPTGNAIAVGHESTPFISVYSWGSSGFGSKFSNPTTLPASAGSAVAFTVNY